jgi:hypothetical protein
MAMAKEKKERIGGAQELASGRHALSAQTK